MALAPYTPRFWPYRMLYWMSTVPVTNKVYVKLTNYQSGLASFTMEKSKSTSLSGITSYLQLIYFTKKSENMARGKASSSEAKYTKISPTVKPMASSPCVPCFLTYHALDWLVTVPVTNKVCIKLINYQIGSASFNFLIKIWNNRYFRA